jgi:hypothetical protein
MSELTVSDEDGEQHFIWIQEKPNSCGPACVYMIERMRRSACIVGAEERIRIITSLLPKGYTDSGGTASYSALALALSEISIPAISSFQSNIPTYMGSAIFPIIARIGWPSGGGHFCVVAKFTKTNKLVCLDPIYGCVQILRTNLPAYATSYDYKNNVAAAAGGTLSGHVVEPNTSGPYY